MINVTESFRNATACVKSWASCDFINIYDEVVDAKAFEQMVSGARVTEDIDTIDTAASRIEDVLLVMLDSEDDEGLEFSSKSELEFFYSMRFVPYMECVDNRKCFPCDVIANRLARVWCDHGDTDPHRNIITMLARGFDYTGKRGDSTLSTDDFCKAALIALGLVRVPLS